MAAIASLRTFIAAHDGLKRVARCTSGWSQGLISRDNNDDSTEDDAFKLAAVQFSFVLNINVHYALLVFKTLCTLLHMQAFKMTFWIILVNVALLSHLLPLPIVNSTEDNLLRRCITVVRFRGCLYKDSVMGEEFNRRIEKQLDE